MKVICRKLLSWLALSALPIGTAVDASASVAPPVPVVEFQGVSIRDVCAWPKLTMLGEHTLIAAIYNQPSHGARPGDVDIYVSEDGGISWGKRGTPTKHSATTGRLNHAVGVTRSGQLIVVSGGWSYDGPNAKGSYRKTSLLRPTASMSSDGGRTWVISSDFPDAPDGMTLVPFGNIETGKDGNLRVAAYSYNQKVKPRVDVCYSVVSSDGGSKWRIGGVIGEPAANETDMLHLGDGRWLAAARNLGSGKGHSIDIYSSQDDAATWRKIGTPTQGGQHPGDLVRLADGRILLTYGDRTSNKGINACLSDDNGLTWSASARISEPITTPTSDFGYPSSAQMKDGTIVTVYYAASSKEHPGYQMCTIRWRLK